MMILIEVFEVDTGFVFTFGLLWLIPGRHVILVNAVAKLVAASNFSRVEAHAQPSIGSGAQLPSGRRAKSQWSPCIHTLILR